MQSHCKIECLIIIKHISAWYIGPMMCPNMKRNKVALYIACNMLRYNNDNMKPRSFKYRRTGLLWPTFSLFSEIMVGQSYFSPNRICIGSDQAYKVASLDHVELISFFLGNGWNICLSLYLAVIHYQSEIYAERKCSVT